MAKIELLDELPIDGNRSRYEDFWQTLAANPGKWALWPGSAKSSPRSLVANRNRKGGSFECRQRNGQTYIRSVA